MRNQWLKEYIPKVGDKVLAISPQGWQVEGRVVAYMPDGGSFDICGPFGIEAVPVTPDYPVLIQVFMYWKVPYSKYVFCTVKQCRKS